ncbi:MAG: protein kinase [Acidobacteriota bacterium]|nr:protein kinase [Acidobacteriota bacterium]
MEESETNPAPVQATPDSIGAYRILGNLGSGGMGEVLLAYDQRLDRKVAVKRIKLDAAFSEEVRARFHREARTAAQLNHPGVVQIYDILEEPSGEYIVMEYAPGKTLAELLQQGALPRKRVLAIAGNVAEALTAAHEKGIVHRDLKPENVVVGEEDAVKILDFGLARRLEADDQSLTGKGQILGTVRTMSPEQVRGDDLDHRTDLFSFGILLYEMTARRSPFKGESSIKTMQNILSLQQAPLMSLCPSAGSRLSHLVDWLLQKEPARRPADMRTVIDALGGIDVGGGLGRTVDEDAETTDISDFSGRSSLLEVHPARHRMVPALVILVLIVGLTLSFYFFIFKAETITVVLGHGSSQNVNSSSISRAILIGAERQLTTLQGITLLSEPVETTEQARLLGADEMVAIDIRPGKPNYGVTLRRVNAGNGTVVWQEAFAVSAGPNDSYNATQSVMAHLRQAYPGYKVSERMEQFTVRPEDFERYLAVRNSTEENGAKWKDMQEILAGSPAFLDGLVYAGELAFYLFKTEKEDKWSAEMKRLIQRARNLAPHDARSYSLEFRLALNNKQWKQAGELLETMESHEPGSMTVLQSRAVLAKAKGNLDEAIKFQKLAAQRMPSKIILYDLASLEFQAGRYNDAIRTTDQLLENYPKYRRGRNLRALLEMEHGDLEEAECMFVDLLQERRTHAIYNNLGVIFYKTARYADAEEAWEQAVALNPDRTRTRVNQADAILAQGRKDEAEGIYWSALTEFEESTQPLKTPEKTARARCLAHLGLGKEAASAVREILRANPSDMEAKLNCAIVYALLGEHYSALALVEEARAGGMKARQFNLPEFAGLRENPAFQKLLKQGPPSTQ